MENATRKLSRSTHYPITISALARQFGLSRSTLLYYDRIGLLCPSAHSDAGYRLYTEGDAQRLTRIHQLREAGLPLKQIQTILTRPDQFTQALEQQFRDNSAQISALQNQQRVLISLLGNPDLISGGKLLTKQSWSEMFVKLGLSEDDMLAWHRRFELNLPNAHQAFLESLGLSDEEIKRIRKRSGASL